MTENSQRERNGEVAVSKSTNEVDDADATAATAAAVSSDYKVRGKKSAPDGAAVVGWNTAISGSARGVEGVTDSSGSDAVGVRGEATAGSGVTFGVDGSTNSRSSEAAGTRGSTTETNHGVLGEAYDTRSNLPQLVSNETSAVFGRTDKNGYSYGVGGWSTESIGVFARSDASSSPALVAINSSTGAGIKLNSSPIIVRSSYMEVDDHVDIGQVGVSAYRSEANGNQTISSGYFQTVKFDAASPDDFGGFDTSLGVYTVQQAGDYHVDFLIDWADSFSSGDAITYELRINGSEDGGLAADTSVPNNAQPARGFSKTLFGLQSDDTIEVAVYQDSGSGKDIWGGSRGQTYLTIAKLG